MKKSWEIAAVQLGPCTGDRRGDEAVAETAVRAAWKSGASLVLLPELATLAYFGFSDPLIWRGRAEKIGGRLVRKFAKIARELGIILALPFFERGDDNTGFNSVVVLGPKGEIVPAVDRFGVKHCTARKLHLPTSGSQFDERDHFCRGETLGVHSASYLTFGVLVCYDRRFPESWRALRGLGAVLALVPVAGPGGDDSAFFLAELRTHARENGLYVCVANKVGVEDVTGSAVPSHGDSCIVSPAGEILAHRSEGEGPGIVRASIDLAFLEQTRARLPLYEERRVDL